MIGISVNMQSLVHGIRNTLGSAGIINETLPFVSNRKKVVEYDDVGNMNIFRTVCSRHKI